MRFTSGSISPEPGIQVRTVGSVTVGLAVDGFVDGVLEGGETVRGVVEAGGLAEPFGVVEVDGVVVAGELGARLLEGFSAEEVLHPASRPAPAINSPRRPSLLAPTAPIG
jgi:hypothetical protein